MTLYQDKSTTHGPSTARDLVETIERGIREGRYAPGERLRPVRALAEDVGLAPNTVAAAYRKLADRGLVESRGRSGTFVSQRPSPPQAVLQPFPGGAVDLASGGPDRRLLPDLGRFIRPVGPATSYTDPTILPGLESAAVDWLRSQGVDVGQLTVTSGALDAVERVLTAYLRPGDAVALERPGWHAMAELLRTLRLRPVGVECDEGGMVPAALGAALPSVEAVVVTPRAQNPTGSAIGEERAAALARVLGAHPDVLVVEDDHAGPVAGASLHPLGPGRTRWAFVQSVAKALGPDLRLAVVSGDDLTIDRVAGRHAVGPGWVSRILQDAVASMMEDRSVAALLGRAGESYAARRMSLIRALQDGGVAGATGRSGLNVWVPVTAEQPVLAAAAEAGFVLLGGTAFESPSPAVRITVSALDPEHIDPLVSAVAGAGHRGRHLV